MECKSIAVVLACALFACALGDTISAGPETTTAPTTPSAATTSTDAPTSTTAQPSTSTAAPTTLPPTTTPSPEPNTTTTAPPVTTPAPVTTTAAPPPSDGRGNWTVSDGNVTCIVAQMVISAKFNYALQTPNKTANREMSVPVTAKASGICDATTQNVKLSWEKNSIDITFGKNDTTKMYYVASFKLEVFADNASFPNISSDLVNKSYTLVSSSDVFKTNFNQSYRCIREESLPLTGNISAALILNKVQLEAFRTKSDKVFATAQDCELDTPDIVPIAVGCALAALVFVVLIAYLVGRRRSQARGYLSIDFVLLK